MNKKAGLSATAAAALLMGCAAPAGFHADYDGPPRSQLAFTPVTAPSELVKWSRDFPGLRSIDTYTFVVPREMEDYPGVVAFDPTVEPGEPFVEAAGREPERDRVIRHTPSQR